MRIRRSKEGHTSYDPLGRFTADTVTAFAAGVDTSVKRLGYSFDSAGRPFQQTSYVNTAGAVSNQVQDQYNGYGQLIQQFQSVNGSVNTSSTPSVQYGYSQPSGANYSRQTTLTYPDGRVISYNYNSGVDATVSRLSGMSDSGSNVESYSYLGLDTIVRKIRPGSVLTYVKTAGTPIGDAGDMYTGLNRFGHVANQQWVTSDTVNTDTTDAAASGDTLGTTTEQFEYGYDADGNVLDRNNIVNPTFSELYHANSSAAGDDNTAYDSLNRITSFRRGTLTSSGNNGSGLDTITSANLNSTFNVPNQDTWTLDAVGNWSASGPAGSTQTRTFNADNEITSISGYSTPLYDHDGNMTTDQSGNVLTFDAWNRLISAQNNYGSPINDYTYNADGTGVLTDVCNSSISDSYYSADGQVLEDDVTNTGLCGQPSSTSTYVWSESYVNDLIERDRSENGGTVARVYAQQDANHDVTSLVDSSGTVLQRYVYDPYGAQMPLAPNWGTTGGSVPYWQYGFQGGRTGADDNIANVVHFGARDYSPTLGRWVQQDPERFLDGFNTYAFETSNPTDHADPTGEYTVDGPGDGVYWYLNGGGAAATMGPSLMSDIRTWSDYEDTLRVIEREARTDAGFVKCGSKPQLFHYNSRSPIELRDPFLNPSAAVDQLALGFHVMLAWKADILVTPSDVSFSLVGPDGRQHCPCCVKGVQVLIAFTATKYITFHGWHNTIFNAFNFMGGKPYTMTGTWQDGFSFNVTQCNDGHHE